MNCLAHYTRFDYRFGFQGQEGDDEVSGEGNSYTAEFWQYDSRLGRRWNVDPKGRIWESSYATFGNNPVINIDIKGDKWKPGSEKSSEEEASRLESEAGSNKAFAQKSLNVQQKKLDKLKNKKSSVKRQQEIVRLQASTTRLKNDINEYDATIVEVGKMRDDPNVTFELKPLSSNSNGRTYNDKGVVVVSYPKGDFNLIAQEMKHGFQVLNGELSLDRFSVFGGVLHDINDEVASYKRGFAYGTYEERAFMKSYSAIDATFVRSLDKNYTKLPSVNLTINTSISLLKTAHKVGIEENMKAGYSNVFTRLGNLSSKYDKEPYSAVKSINILELWNKP